jgi:hypothetical protein
MKSAISPAKQRAAILDTTPVRAFVAEAVAFGGQPFAGARRVVIRSISARQRPRR